ncbi:hypothetical protein C8R44DRAFT_732160 [Mycena epipterygia]|nr:hypothetical protein C8R44DRAFT_732160 [Mycena epipterygia]
MTAENPRPVFIYGTLRAMPLLAWALTGDSTKIETVQPLAQPATVKGYARFSIHHSDYPAVVRDTPTSLVDGLLLRFQTSLQRQKLDDFEGEVYKPTQVEVCVENENGDVGGAQMQVVDADMYVWDGDLDAIDRDTPWELDQFIQERLDDWLELFAPMELTGGHPSEEKKNEGTEHGMPSHEDSTGSASASGCVWGTGPADNVAAVYI